MHMTALRGGISNALNVLITYKQVPANREPDEDVRTHKIQATTDQFNR